jgi:uncharacterized protein YndB with AHSA1/START domain
MRIETVTEITRSPEVVFAVLTDAAKLPAWQPNTTAVKREQEGPLTAGERFREVHRTMGRDLHSTVEVTACETPRLFELRIVSGPMPLDGRWELEPSAAGTRLRFTGDARVRGPMRLLKPMLARQFRGYHERLKELVEQDGATS